MYNTINEPVTVTTTYHYPTNKTIPEEVFWRGRNYKIKRLGLHHSYKRGSQLFHVFSVCSDVIHFKLVLDTKDLSWRLEEIYAEEGGK